MQSIIGVFDGNSVFGDARLTGVNSGMPAFDDASFDGVSKSLLSPSSITVDVVEDWLPLRDNWDFFMEGPRGVSVSRSEDLVGLKGSEPVSDSPELGLVLGRPVRSNEDSSGKTGLVVCSLATVLRLVPRSSNRFNSDPSPRNPFSENCVGVASPAS
jgi:hypothetical protein